MSDATTPADRSTMSDHDVWLCYQCLDSGRYEVEAIYNNEAEAEAWLAGVNAAYSRGYIMCVDANEGPIDFDKWREEAEWLATAREAVR